MSSLSSFLHDHQDRLKRQAAALKNALKEAQATYSSNIDQKIETEMKTKLELVKSVVPELLGVKVKQSFKKKSVH
jgi:hypothetical protein